MHKTAFSAPPPAVGGGHRLGAGGSSGSGGGDGVGVGVRADSGLGSGDAVDEVSLKLKAVSEALTLLQDAAILPSLYRLLESAQAEVDLRPEARAKAVAADRIERVSGASVYTCTNIFVVF